MVLLFGILDFALLLGIAPAGDGMNDDGSFFYYEKEQTNIKLKNLEYGNSLHRKIKYSKYIIIKPKSNPWIV